MKITNDLWEIKDKSNPQWNHKYHLRSRLGEHEETYTRTEPEFFGSGKAQNIAGFGVMRKTIKFRFWKHSSSNGS